jgi:hypothetical protein
VLAPESIDQAVCQLESVETVPDVNALVATLIPRGATAAAQR